jgi:hypothetical protein
VRVSDEAVTFTYNTGFMFEIRSEWDRSSETSALLGDRDLYLLNEMFGA